MKKPMKISFITISFLSAITLSNNVIADTWSERKALVQLKEEVAALQILAKHAKSKSDSKNRVQFQYQVLLNDLKTIENGLTLHLAKPFEAQVPASGSREHLGIGYTKRALPPQER